MPGAAAGAPVQPVRDWPLSPKHLKWTALTAGAIGLLAISVLLRPIAPPDAPPPDGPIVATTASSGGEALAKTGGVRIESEPSGAHVLLANGTDTGNRTPVEFRDLPPGPFRYTLKLDGYSEGLAAGSVTKGRVLQVVVTLDRLRN